MTPRNRVTQLGDTVVAGAATYRRRSVVFAASSGLLVTMGLPAAASPLTDVEEQPATQSVPVVPAEAALTTTGSVSVPTDAQADFALSALTTVDSAQAEADAAARAAEEAARAAEEAARAERAAAADRASRDLGGSRGSTAAGIAQGAASAAVAGLAGAGAALEVGSRYIGTPYRYGGTSPDGFDCSGFIQYVYGQMGVDLPRTAAAQASAGTRVSASEAEPGDIVSFTGAGGVYHNGIYAGNGQMLDSPRSGKSIGVRDIWSSSVTFTRVA